MSRIRPTALLLAASLLAGAPARAQDEPTAAPFTGEVDVADGTARFSICTISTGRSTRLPNQQAYPWSQVSNGFMIRHQGPRHLEIVG